MKVGFTGTQIGMSVRQKELLRDWLMKWKISEFHHGDCIGADAEAHDIVKSLNIPIFIHPPINPIKRAFCQGYTGIWLPQDYLVRNHDIVNETLFLVVAPKSMERELRSGTWATYRYALKVGHPTYLLQR